MGCQYAQYPNLERGYVDSVEFLPAGGLCCCWAFEQLQE